MKKIFLSIILVNLLAACASETPKEAVEEPTPAVAETEATAPVEPAQAPVETVEAAMPEERSVYFPFDVDAVQAADRATVQAHGEYLSKNADVKLRVEGNADERGSSEYNLALGQRRANNVKKLLILSGAQASQIETMSYGEEKPRCAEHNESCWSQNRRADIVAK